MAKRTRAPYTPDPSVTKVGIRMPADLAKLLGRTTDNHPSVGATAGILLYLAALERYPRLAQFAERAQNMQPAAAVASVADAITELVFDEWFLRCVKSLTAEEKAKLLAHARLKSL